MEDFEDGLDAAELLFRKAKRTMLNAMGFNERREMVKRILKYTGIFLAGLSGATVTKAPSKKLYNKQLRSSHRIPHKRDDFNRT